MRNVDSFSWEWFHNAPIIGILRGIPDDVACAIADQYMDAGLTTLEVTMNTDHAAAIITRLRADFPQLNVGAGTVCTMQDFSLALKAGAQFVVTPVINEEVVEAAVSAGIPIFPGAYSPTEIYKAWTLGADAVKVFPATILGPSFIKDVLGPLDTIKVIPTGGVSLENIRSFFEAGAYGVGMGSSLVDKSLIVQRDFEGLKTHFTRVKNEIRDFIPATRDS